MKADVLKLDATKAGDVDLSDDIYGLDPRADILHRMVTYQLAKRQQGTHAVKERNAVSGTTKKFGKQKGGGGARHGNRKACLLYTSPSPRDQRGSRMPSSA